MDKKTADLWRHTKVLIPIGKGHVKEGAAEQRDTHFAEKEQPTGSPNQHDQENQRVNRSCGFSGIAF